jgi:hypothetical protein
MPEPVHILLWSVVLGLSAVALTKCIRALPPFAGWTLDLKKPWACDICMSFWGVVLLSGAMFWRDPSSLELQPFLGMVGWCVSYFGLQKLSEPQTPFEMPPLADSGEDNAGK